MLHFDIEVLAVQFFIYSSSEYCQMQFNNSFATTSLESKVKCKCSDVQEIKEKTELYIQYVEKANLKLQFYDGQNIVGEANINLGFYIENNLPVIIDSITISNQFDSEAQIQVSLAWSQADSNSKNNALQQNTQQTIQYNRPASPIRSQPQPTPPPQRPVIQKKPADELHFEKRTVHATYTKWKDHQEQVKEMHQKKLKEPVRKPQIEDEKFEDIKKQEVKPMSPRRFQTPKDYKPTSMINKPYNNTSNSNNLALPYPSQINNRAHSKSPNRNDSRLKGKNENYVTSQQQQQEQSDVQKIQKQKTLPKKNEQVESLRNQNSQADMGQSLSSKQFDNGTDNENGRGSIQKISSENNQLKNQVQKLNAENVQLKDQLIKSEAAFNLLSETYSALRNEYQKISVKSFANSSSQSLLANKEQDHLRREIEQKTKEIEFYKKEADLWKKDLEVTKRENNQIKKEIENFKKDLINKEYEQENNKRELDNKKKEVETLERDLSRAKQAILLIQDESFRSVSKVQTGSGNNQDKMLDQMKNLIKTLQIEVDGKNEEIKQNKQRIIQLEKELSDRSRKTYDQYDQIKYVNTQLEQENEKLKQQITEKNLELNLKQAEIDRLLNQQNIIIQQPDCQNQDVNRILNEYSAQIASLKQENQSFSLQNKKDQVKLESLQKELEITKNIVELSDQRQSSLESEIQQLERAVVAGKQNMADVINAVMECGGPQLAEEVERFLIIRRSTKIS